MLFVSPDIHCYFYVSIPIFVYSPDIILIVNPYLIVLWFTCFIIAKNCSNYLLRPRGCPYSYQIWKVIFLIDFTDTVILSYYFWLILIPLHRSMKRTYWQIGNLCQQTLTSRQIFDFEIWFHLFDYEMITKLHGMRLVNPQDILSDYFWESNFVSITG